MCVKLSACVSPYIAMSVCASAVLCVCVGASCLMFDRSWATCVELFAAFSARLRVIFYLSVSTRLSVYGFSRVFVIPSKCVVLCGSLCMTHSRVRNN